MVRNSSRALRSSHTCSTTTGEQFLPEFRKFNAKRKFLAAVTVVKTANRLRKLISNTNSSGAQPIGGIDEADDSSDPATTQERARRLTVDLMGDFENRGNLLARLRSVSVPVQPHIATTIPAQGQVASRQPVGARDIRATELTNSLLGELVEPGCLVSTASTEDFRARVSSIGGAARLKHAKRLLLQRQLNASQETIREFPAWLADSGSINCFNFSNACLWLLSGTMEYFVSTAPGGVLEKRTVTTTPLGSSEV